MKTLLTLLSVLILLSSCDLYEDIESTPDTVTYNLSGTAPTVNITINNKDGGTEQFSNISLPWSYSFEAYSDFFMYLSAQNQGSAGSVTATINVNGGQYKTSTSSGAYVIASVSGSL